MYKTLKKRVHRIMEPSDSSPLEGQIFTIFIMALIILNVLGVILETVESYNARYMRFFSVGVHRAVSKKAEEKRFLPALRQAGSLAAASCFLQTYRAG